MKSKQKLQRKKFSPLNIRRKGLFALLLISIFAGIGSYQVWNSRAATVYRSEALSAATSEGCMLVGRKWVNGNCSTTCIQTGDKVIAGTNYVVGGEKLGSGFCPGAVQQTVTRDQCTGIGRRWVYSTGCARQLNQTTNKLNSVHCIDSTATYTVPSNSCVCPTGTERDAGNGKCVPPGTASVVYTGTDTIVPSDGTVSLYSSTFDQAVHSRLNVFRSNANLKLLKENACLAKYARASAKRMAENNSMTHATNLRNAISECGANKIGENIAAGFTDPIRLCAAWYNSETHRRNMLEPSYDLLAVASYKSSTGRVYTASWYMAN